MNIQANGDVSLYAILFSDEKKLGTKPQKDMNES